MKERLQKLLSARGVASRRHAERLIAEGKVAVNGIPATLGDSADPDVDRIEVDGAALPDAPSALCYIALHKPVGYVTTMSDEQGRKTVQELASGTGVRVYPVGRLDINSSGLLLMTNDGDLTYRLTHPKHEVDKEYRVAVEGDAEAALPVLSAPIELDGYWTSPAKVRVVRKTAESAVLSVVIHEGRNRQVRRMCEAVNLRVLWLNRIRVGKIRIDGIEPGKWRSLTDEEIAYLKSL